MQRSGLSYDHECGRGVRARCHDREQSVTAVWCRVSRGGMQRHDRASPHASECTCDPGWTEGLASANTGTSMDKVMAAASGAAAPSCACVATRPTSRAKTGSPSCKGRSFGGAHRRA
jgi:hypothetical protein